MWEFVKQEWDYFHGSFHGSDTIVWARAQFLLLAASGYTAVQGVDMSVFISDKHQLQIYIFANALITEMLRRRNATDLH